MRMFCLVLLLVSAGFFYTTAAQSSGKQVSLTDNSVVKDSAGNVYPAQIWKNLLATGWYTIKIKKPQDENPEFTLVRLNEKEYKRRMENLAKPRESEYFTTGKPVSGFTATDIYGRKYKLKDLKGKVVVMNFWFIACQPCQQEIPELNDLADEYRDSANVVFLAVCLDDKELIEKFLEKQPFRYTIIDNGRSITSQYGIKSYPTHLVLNKEGIVVYHSSGYGLGLTTWLRKSIAKALE